jgi:hypothetical protein
MVPPAVSVCHRGFQIYRSGQWEELEACFEMIQATTDNTCGANATMDIGACVSTMYAHACNNADAVTTCDQTAASCATANDPNFKTDACKADLAAFSTTGINAYIACLNDPANKGVACADLHSTCFGVVTSY